MAGYVGIRNPMAEATFRSAKLSAELFKTPAARAELQAFRDLAAARARLVWPLAASGFLGAEQRQEDQVVSVVWRFEAGSLVMMVNPTDSPANAHGPFGAERPPEAPAAFVGTVEAGVPCQIDPFSAMVWSDAR